MTNLVQREEGEFIDTVEVIPNELPNRRTQFAPTFRNSRVIPLSIFIESEKFRVD